MEQSPGKAPVELSKGKHFMVMLSASVMIVCVSLAGTGLTVNMSSILSRFNATSLYGVVAVMGVLSMALATPVAASMAASMGIRKVAAIDAALMLLFSVLTAVTANTNLILFIISRFALYFSAGMISGSIFPVASYIYTPKDSGKGYGIFTAAIALGGVVGGTVSGFLADKNLLLGAIVYPGLVCAIGSIPLLLYFPTLPGRQRKTDFVGLLMLVALLTLLLIPLNLNRMFGGWGSPVVIGCIIMFFVMAIVMYIYESKQSNPLIPFRLFKNRGFSAACVIGLAGVGVFTAMQSNYIPILCQSVLGTTASVSGMVPMPKTIVTIILPSIVATWMVKKQGRHWVVLMMSGLFVALPSLVLAFNCSPPTPLVLIFVMVAFVGIADSCKGAALNNYAQSKLDMADVPQGIALLGLISTIATVISSTIHGLLLNLWVPTNILPESVKSELTSAQLTRLSQSGSYMASNPAVADIRVTLPQNMTVEFDAAIYAVREALGAAIGNMMMVCVACGVIVMFVSVFVVRQKKQAEAAGESSI